MPRVWHRALVIRPRCEDRCSLETPSACPEASASLSRPSPCSRCCRSPALSSSVSSLVSHTAGAAESAGQVQVLAAVSGRFLLGPRGPPCWGGPLASWSRREPVSPSPGAVSIRHGRLCIYGEDHLLRVSIALARSVRRPTGSGRTLPGLARVQVSAFRSRLPGLGPQWCWPVTLRVPVCGGPWSGSRWPHKPPACLLFSAWPLPPGGLRRAPLLVCFRPTGSAPRRPPPRPFVPSVRHSCSASRRGTWGGGASPCCPAGAACLTRGRAERAHGPAHRGCCGDPHGLRPGAPHRRRSRRDDRSKRPACPAALPPEGAGCLGAGREPSSLPSRALPRALAWRAGSSPHGARALSCVSWTLRSLFQAFSF